MNANSRNRESGRWIGRVGATLALVALFAGGALADELKDARSALAAGQLDQARALFEKVSSQGFAEGAAGVGQVHLRRREYAAAAEAFEKAQKMDANLALAWYGQGEVLRRQEDLQAARLRHAQAVFDYLSTMASLDALTGDIFARYGLTAD